MKIIHFIPVSVEFITEFGHNKSHEIYSRRLTASMLSHRIRKEVNVVPIGNKKQKYTQYKFIENKNVYRNQI